MMTMNRTNIAMVANVIWLVIFVVGLLTPFIPGYVFVMAGMFFLGFRAGLMVRGE